MIAGWSLVLALVWIGMTGVITVPNLIAGYAASWMVLTFIWRRAAASTLLRAWWVLDFAGFFVVELLVANLRVAYDVVTPRHHMRPGVIGVPLDAETEVEIALLANLVSLTPGTLSLDVSKDRRTLYVHAMYVDDRGQLVQQIKRGFERRLLRVLR